MLYYICIINSSIFMLIYFMWRKRHLCNMFEFFLWNSLAKNKRQPIKFSAWAAFYLSLWDMYWMKYTRTNIVSWSHKNAFWQEMKRNQKLGKKGHIKQHDLDHISNSTEIPDHSIIENIFILKTNVKHWITIVKLKISKQFI